MIKPSEQAVPDPFIGQVIQDRYRILKCIGAGGMGIVYLAEHMLIKRKVAIKTLHGQFVSDANLMARFRREALASSAVGNEHIIDVTDMGQLPNGSFFMVLEYLEGTEFGKEINTNGPQPTGRVVRIVNQVCEGLTAVHNAGIVHRDLKPGNLFLIKRGDNRDFVKILDFGISKFRESLDGESAKMTTTGTVLGTPRFMSPEQAEGSSEIDHRCDIYAIGAIMFYAMTGSYPFDATTLPMLLIRICTEMPSDIRGLRPDIPEELAFIVQKCLAKNPEERFQTCAELKQAIAPFAHLDDAPEVNPNALVKKKRRARERISGIQAAPIVNEQPNKRRKLRILGAGLAVAALGGIAVLVISAPNEEPTVNIVQSAAPLTETSAVKTDETVRIKIRTTPSGAELFLDGQPVTNPFQGDLPNSSKPRRIEARLEGYQPLVQQLSLQFPQNVQLDLKRVPEQAGNTQDQQPTTSIVDKQRKLQRPPQQHAILEPYTTSQSTDPPAIPASPSETSPKAHDPEADQSEPAEQAKRKKRGLRDVF